VDTSIPLHNLSLAAERKLREPTTTHRAPQTCLKLPELLLKGRQPAKTIEIYWYAGEEGGLLGSAEIAADAKANAKNVIGVLQLDMTLHPGDGEFKLGSMTDFTSLSMREHLAKINSQPTLARRSLRTSVVTVARIMRAGTKMASPL
jgi:hypothetical protein